MSARLQLFGPPGLELSTGQAPPELMWRKHFGLLAYLHLSALRRVSRDHLLDLLWGEKPETAARHSLNEALRVLRRALGADAIDTTGDLVGLAAPVESDLRAAEALIRAGDHGAAAALIRGEFLEGVAIAGASGFEDWLAVVRLEWRRRGADLLTTVAAQALASGDTERAVAMARRAVSLDAGGLATVSLAVRAEALAGDRAAALGHFERFAAEGGRPDGALEVLVSRVRAMAPGPSSPAQQELSRTRRIPLAGRARDLARLVGLWEEAAGGGARLALIRGDPGAGKSRLLEEVGERARLAGATVLQLRAVPADAATAEAGLRALAAGPLRHARGVAAAPAAALATLAECHPGWLEQFPGALTAGTMPFRQAVTEVLRAATGDAPVVVGIDDAQWLDEAALDVIVALGRDLADAPLLVVLTWTPDPPCVPLEAVAARVGRDLAGAIIPLSPLTTADLERLVGAIFPQFDTEATSRLARRIAADSAGLPLLAVELLHAVAGGLDLRGAPAPWPAPQRTLDQTRPGTLPEVLVAAIRLGFRRLSLPAQRILGALAVLDERVPGEVLGRAAALTPADRDAGLEELEWQRWLRAEARGYSFVARVAREVVARDLVTPGQAARMRRQAESP